jgi:hypothetical protein
MCDVRTFASTSDPARSTVEEACESGWNPSEAWQAVRSGARLVEPFRVVERPSGLWRAAPGAGFAVATDYARSRATAISTNHPTTTMPIAGAAHSAMKFTS